ncbi:MAG: hydrogenase 3 maturation endopeptidase HyCI [Candidatus Omnitrophota bacterium]
MEDLLIPILKGKTVIVGIGNPLRGDDGVGPYLVEILQGRVNAVCIDAGTAPESYIGKILKEFPDTVLIVDAVHLGLEAGACQVLEGDEILKSGLTTHDLSPRMFMDHLRQGSRARIYMLGVQPQRVLFGDAMSGSVKKTTEQLAAAITEVLGA